MAKKTGSASSSNEVFDIERIRQLVELMKENELNEVDLQHDEQRIKLRRGPEAGAAMPPVGYYPAAPSAPPAAAPAAAVSATESPAAADNATYIVSPMVGSFYAKPNPDAKPYVSVGDSVSPDTVVCSVEAMKMFNEIPAGMSGKIVEMLVQDGQAVDVNKPLFRVQPS